MPNPTGFPQIDTEKVVDILVDDMLQKFHGKHPDLDKRIDAAWQARHGVPFRPFRPNPVALYGPPGHGKTTSFRVAAAKVAELLDLNLVVDPADVTISEGGRQVYFPGDNDLLFITMDNANKKSAIDFGGIPAKKEVEGREYMTKLLQYRLAILNDAAAGVLLLDDLMNADKAFQDACMPIINEGKYDALSIPHVLVGVTGNLGSLDGTNAGKPSTAMRSRARNFYVEDSPPKFISRIQSRYDDDLGDAGLGGLIRYDNSLLYGSASQPYESFSCPRALTNLAEDLRRIFYVHARDMGRALEEIQTVAEAMVGREASHKIASYYHMMMTSALPVARQFIEHGKLDEKAEKIFKERRGSNHSAEAQQFEYQLAVAGADLVVNKATSGTGKRLSLAIHNYGKMLAKLSDTSISVSVIHFLENLENRGVMTNEAGQIDIKAKKILMNKIAAGFKESGGADRMEVLADALSAYVRDGAQGDEYLKVGPGLG